MKHSATPTTVLRRHRLTLFAILGLTCAGFIMLGNLFVLVVRDAQYRMVDAVVRPLPVMFASVAAQPDVTDAYMQTVLEESKDSLDGIVSIAVFKSTEDGFKVQAMIPENITEYHETASAVAAQALPNTTMSVVHENGFVEVSRAFTDEQGVLLGYVEVVARADLFAAPIERNLIRTLVVLLFVLFGTFFILMWFMGAREQRRLIKQTAQYAKLQDEMITRMVHDIQNPLTVATGYVTMLKGLELSSAAQELLVKVRRALQQLSRFVQHAEVAVALERQQIPLVVDRVQVTPAVQAAIEKVARTRDIATTNISFTVQVDAVAQTDVARLQFALEQVIDNALQHGKPPVTVSVRVEGGDIVITVLDTGVSLSKDDSELVTQKWHHGAHVTAGSGLGMWLAATLLKQARGSMRMHVDANKGTAVHIRIPRAL